MQSHPPQKTRGKTSTTNWYWAYSYVGPYTYMWSQTACRTRALLTPVPPRILSCTDTVHAEAQTPWHSLFVQSWFHVESDILHSQLGGKVDIVWDVSFGILDRQVTVPELLAVAKPSSKICECLWETLHTVFTCCHFCMFLVDSCEVFLKSKID